MSRVVAPDGRSWTVRRRWDPHRHETTFRARAKDRYDQFRERFGILDMGEGAFDLAEIGGALVAVLVMVLLFVAVIYIVIPALFLLIDVVVLLVLVGVAIVARVLFRRPWRIEARDGDDTVLRWEVVGWRASGEAVDRIGQQLAAGLPPDPG